MYIAIYAGFHNERPDWTPDITATVDEFIADNRASLTVGEIDSIIALDGSAVVRIGGGAAPEFTVFADPDFDPNHEGCEW